MLLKFREKTRLRNRNRSTFVTNVVQIHITMIIVMRLQRIDPNTLKGRKVEIEVVTEIDQSHHSEEKIIVRTLEIQDLPIGRLIDLPIVHTDALILEIEVILLTDLLIAEILASLREEQITEPIQGIGTNRLNDITI